MNTTTTKHDLTWVDYLRVIACFLVVLAHCCDAYVSASSAESFMAGSIWGTFYRPSVPLFIMITGVLLMPTSMRIAEFYSRRLKRVLIPFAFWSILSPFLFYILVSSVTMLNPTINPDHHTITAVLNNVWLWIFSFNYSTIPYWYVYMMVGVYLIIPIISVWVKQATQQELKMVLKLWFFTTFIQYIEIILPFIGYQGNYGSFGIFGNCSWNIYTTFQYVGGFIGYVLLAHYLVKYPVQWSMKKTVALCILGWVVGYAISFGGFHYVRNTYPDNFNMLEIPWSYTSFNVVIMTVPIFLLIQKMNLRPCALITKLAEYSYGIFLIHFVIVHACYEFVSRVIIIPPFFQLFVVVLVSFPISALIIAGLRQISLFRKLT